MHDINGDGKTWKKFYHVFADGYDEYYGENEFEKALADYYRLQREGYIGGRLYEMYELYEDGEPTGDFSDGDCLNSFGEYPM